MVRTLTILRRFLEQSNLVRSATLVLMSVVVSACHVEPENTPPAAAPDLSEHPIYSKYDFGSSEDVIDIGIQPIWVPTCIISEVMRRDKVLKEQLSELGFEIRFHSFMKGADVNFFLGRGDLEAGIGGDMPAITAAAEFDAVIAGLVQHGFCTIVSNRHMLVSELRGKRIAYAFGSNAHYALLEALSSEEISESDVSLIALDVNEMPQALDEGRIDAFSAWEPTPTIAKVLYEDQVSVHRSLSTGYLYFARSFAEQQPEAMFLIVASKLRALDWLKTSKDNTLEASGWAVQAGQSILGKGSVLTAEDYASLAAADLLGLSTPLMPKEDLIPGATLSREFEFLKSLGKISADASWEKVQTRFDHSIVDSVLSGGAKYRLSANGEFVDL